MWWCPCAPSGQPALAPLPDGVHGQLDGKNVISNITINIYNILRDYNIIIRMVSNIDPI